MSFTVREPRSAYVIRISGVSFADLDRFVLANLAVSLPISCGCGWIDLSTTKNPVDHFVSPLAASPGQSESLPTLNAHYQYLRPYDWPGPLAPLGLVNHNSQVFVSKC